MLAWADAMDAAMASGIINCKRLMDIGHAALVKAGAPESAASGAPEAPGSPRLVGGIDSYWLAVCDFTVPSLRVGPILDDIAFFTVTCFEPGTFEITVADQDDGDRIVEVPGDGVGTGLQFVLHDTKTSVTKTVVCKDAPTTRSEFLVYPNVVEIIPAPGNVSHSLVLVSLLDRNGEAAASGYEVDFAVDRCSIETSGIDTPQKLFDAVNVFSVLNPLLPETAKTVEASDAARAPVDSDRQRDTTLSFDIGDPVVSRAGAVLSCSPEDAPGATPGIATVSVIIEIEDDEDIVMSVQIKVVGPPKKLAMEARPATVACGEKIGVVVQVQDATGQPVSDNTRVEVVTNRGGILAGTGAVAANEANVVPVSSTVASTYTVYQAQGDQTVPIGGIVTFFLLTSTEHTGPYEIVVASGGTAPDGKSFVTPVESAQVSVGCIRQGVLAQQQAEAAAPQLAQPPPAQPAVTAPRTGTGLITPPNTGDAGLTRPDQGGRWTAGIALGLLLSSALGLALARRRLRAHPRP
jgi:hypothetical protein